MLRFDLDMLVWLNCRMACYRNSWHIIEIWWDDCWGWCFKFNYSTNFFKSFLYIIYCHNIFNRTRPRLQSAPINRHMPHTPTTGQFQTTSTRKHHSTISSFKQTWKVYINSRFQLYANYSSSKPLRNSTHQHVPIESALVEISHQTRSHVR